MLTQVFPAQLVDSMSMNDSYILVLDAPEYKKQVPVLIGYCEAQAVIMAIEQQQTKRPFTHALIGNIMEDFMLSLEKVVIDRFDEGVFCSTMWISDGFSEKAIDARTSDAVALAILKHCKIMMDVNVLKETCMEPGALTGNLPKNDVIVENTLQELEEQLHQCIANEDYEQAAEIERQMDALRNGMDEEN